ncbi:hypothetical protein [Candidatus Palauibacter sp.]|uniref:hypothetical protein n=1 Tax=Candidatus Palauibacter sp. TaxID=3101350 RepID=UPI003B012417
MIPVGENGDDVFVEVGQHALEGFRGARGLPAPVPGGLGGGGVAGGPPDGPAVRSIDRVRHANS